MPYLLQKYLAWQKTHQDSWVKAQLALLTSREELFKKLRMILLSRQSRKCLLDGKRRITPWLPILSGSIRSNSCISLIPSFETIVLQKYKIIKAVRRHLEDIKAMNSKPSLTHSTSDPKVFSQLRNKEEKRHYCWIWMKRPYVELLGILMQNPILASVLKYWVKKIEQIRSSMLMSHEFSNVKNLNKAEYQKSNMSSWLQSL